MRRKEIDMRMGTSLRNMKSLLIKALGVLLALVAGFPIAAALAAVDSYPSKPVRFIIATSPGGSTDVVGRLIATKLSERLGKQMIPVNSGGAGGTIAAETAMRADPDGYTLLFTSTQIVFNPLLFKVDYDPVKSFVPVAKMGNGPNVLAVHPSVPANSVKELIALMKKQPGKLICSSSGGGSFTHLASALFEYLADVDCKMVQFKGGGPSLIDTIGGHSQILLTSLTTALPQIKAGKLRALGFGGTTRSKLLPDVPTISEAGVPGYEAAIWWSIFAPVGTPKPIVERLQKELAAIMNAEETKKAFEVQGAEPDFMATAEFIKLIEAESAKWEKVIKAGNIKAEE
jgi:tripartite-type tricarboxylate transporter receptor subunit TctC